MGVIRLNGHVGYASAGFGSLEPASTTRTSAMGWPATQIARGLNEAKVEYSLIQYQQQKRNRLALQLPSKSVAHTILRVN